jgi:hypothetical protein
MMLNTKEPDLLCCRRVAAAAEGLAARRSSRSEAEREALAKAHGCVESTHFAPNCCVTGSATGQASRQCRGDDHSGLCIVTLEPCRKPYRRRGVDAVFLPEGSKLWRERQFEDGEIVLFRPTGRQPETFSNGHRSMLARWLRSFSALALTPIRARRARRCPDRSRGGDETSPFGEKRDSAAEKLKTRRERSGRFAVVRASQNRYFRQACIKLIQLRIWAAEQTRNTRDQEFPLMPWAATTGRTWCCPGLLKVAERRPTSGS